MVCKIFVQPNLLQQRIIMIVCANAGLHKQNQFFWEWIDIDIHMSAASEPSHYLTLMNVMRMKEIDIIRNRGIFNNLNLVTYIK